MANTLPPSCVVFRTGNHLWSVVAIFGIVFLGFGAWIAATRSDWSFVVIVAGALAAIFLLLTYLKLEIQDTGFHYRNLTTNRFVPFADIEIAYFETIRASAAPQGVATFWVRLRDGKALKINLRTFPIRAAAVLFKAFERHGIEIVVPETWSARRMAAQIRAEQDTLVE
jgi:CDP-diglyceride synthetase